MDNGRCMEELSLETGVEIWGVDGEHFVVLISPSLAYFPNLFRSNFRFVLLLHSLACIAQTSNLL